MTELTFIEDSIQQAECTSFSNTRGTLTRMDHMLSHKTNLDKYKRTEPHKLFWTVTESDCTSVAQKYLENSTHLEIKQHTTNTWVKEKTTK